MSTNNNIKRAAIYIRVSTDEQARHGYSLEAQEEDLVSYAKAHNYFIVDTYIDDGASARKAMSRRKEFQRMLHDVKMSKIDIILFIKLDRWFRSVSDYYKIQDVLDDHNVCWETTQEDYNTTTSSGRLHLNIKLSVAQNESDQTSERIKFVFANKLNHKQIISGNLPYGYISKDKHVVPDPEKAAQMLSIFEYYATYGNISETLAYAKQYGIAWARVSLRRALQNETYIGNRHGVKDFCPAIVPVDLFNKIQSLLGQRRARQSSVHRIYIFAGLLRCPECGGLLSSNRGALYKGEYLHFYRCTKHYNKKTCSFGRTIFEKTLESYLLKHLEEQLSAYIIEVDSCQTSEKKTSPLEKAKTIRQKLNRLKDLYVDGLIDKAAYTSDYKKLNAELTDALGSQKPQRPTVQPILRDLLKNDIRSLYSQLGRKEKHAFWCNIIDRIEVTGTNDFRVVFLD